MSNKNIVSIIGTGVIGAGWAARFLAKGYVVKAYDPNKQSLDQLKINGIKKGQSESIIDETELSEGKRLSESFLTNTKNYIENKFRKDGFLNTTVNLITRPDTIGSNKLNLIVDVNKGEE